MGRTEIIDINDYIRTVEQTLGSRLSTEQRIGEVIDLDNVINRLHSFGSHITNPGAIAIVAKLEKRAVSCRKAITQVYLRKACLN